MVWSSKQSILGGLCSEQNAFSRAAGAQGARSGIFFHGSISFAKTVPTSYRTPAYIHIRRKASGDDMSNADLEATSIDRLIAMYGSRSKNT